MIMFQKMSEYPSIMEEEFAWAWITQWCPCVQYGGGLSFWGVTAPYQWESGYRHAWINSQPSRHAWWFPNLYTCNIPGPSWNNTLTTIYHWRRSNYDLTIWLLIYLSGFLPKNAILGSISKSFSASDESAFGIFTRKCTLPKVRSSLAKKKYASIVHMYLWFRQEKSWVNICSQNYPAYK